MPLIRKSSEVTSKEDILTSLENELKIAIENQEFEKAAELRDKINQMKEGGNNE